MAEVKLTVFPEVAVARNTTSVPTRVSFGVSKLMVWSNKLLLAIGPMTEDKLPWLSSKTKYTWGKGIVRAHLRTLILVGDDPAETVADPSTVSKLSMVS